MFAKLEHFADVFGVEERLSTADVHLLHARVSKKLQRMFGVIERENVVILRCVEAEAALVVTASECCTLERDEAR